MQITTVIGRRRLSAATIMALFAAILLTLSAAPVGATPNPVPFIDGISPVSVAPGGSDFTLTVTGANFVSTSTVYWGTNALSTTYVSATKLTATVTSSLIASGGAGWITVASAGVARSNVLYLTVGNPQSSIVVDSESYSVQSGTQNVAEGEFNNDGIMDLVTADASSHIMVFLGNGDGTFAAGVPYTVNNGPYRIKVADVNGDGNLDLVVGAASGAGGVAILLGAGDGTFGTATQLSGVTCGLDPQVADFDGDGKLDIVAGAECGGSNIVFYKGNGDGTFQSPTTISNSIGAAFGFTVGDFDGNGTIDFAVARYSTNTVFVFLGNGDGTFQTPSTYSAPSTPLGLAAADFNGDGYVDLAVAGSGGLDVLINKADGTGTFNSAQSVASGFLRGVTTGDINADGKTDIISVGGASAEVSLGNGNGTFQSATSVGSGISFTTSVVLGNFVTSGGMGFAVGNGNTSLLVFLPTVVVSPGSINFGTINVGSSSSSQAFTVTNDTANSITISGVSFTGTNPGDFSETDNCTSSPVVSGGTCTVNVTFTPAATGSRSATLSVADNAPGNPHTAAVSGAGAAAPIVQLSSGSLSFGNQNDGSTSSPQSVTVTNTGNASLTSVSISITGTNSGEFGQSNNCGSTLTQGSNCSINVTFSPATPGAKSASVQISDNAGNSPQSISVTGTGIALAPVAGLSTGSLNFNTQSLGTSSSSQGITVTNTGNANLSISAVGISGANAGDFSQTNNCGSLTPTSTCSINVTFTPTATGSRSASVSISDNASNSPQSVTLGGTGTQTAASLSYTQAAPSPLVAGSSVGAIRVGVYDALSALVTGSSASVQVTITGPNAFSNSQTQSAISGIATFDFSSVHLNTDGLYTITATSSGLTSAVSTTTVTALRSSEGIVVTGFPSPTYSNVPHNVTVAVEDSYGNVITSYTGNVTVTTSDSAGVITPSQHTFTGADQGSFVFTVNLVTAGTQSISATDGTLSGSESNILVNTRPHFVVNTLADDTGSAACDGNEPCSLRSAIQQSNTQGAGDIALDTTQFGAAPWTVLLANGVLELAGNISINGPGASQFSVSGNNASPVFQIDGSSTASLGNLTVTNGQSNTNGGGISNAGALTTSQMVVSNNTAAQNGGGIYNTGNVAFNTSTVSGNTASGSGGGIASTQSFILYDSTVSGNTATVNGGAVDNSGPFYFTQDTLAGNTASDGAAIENEVAGTMAMSQSTVSTNTATSQSGGAISSLNTNSGAVAINNSIVAGNSTQGGDCLSCGTQNPANLFDTSSAALKLNPLANNGGPTQTMMPVSGSPAAGAGNVALALDAAFSTPLTSDQRGPNYIRIINGLVDLGSVQSNSGVPSALAMSLPTSVAAGAPQSLTVGAVTPGGNPAATYAGTVHFTSSDASAQLPADYTFTSGDAGTHTFSVTFQTSGSQSLTATDTVTSGLSASQSVTVGAGADFTVAAVAGSGQSVIVGAAFTNALSARVTDAYGNNVSGATVVFTAPASGASGLFGSSATASAQTNGSGIATAPSFTANNTAGQYTVYASVQGVQTSASFSLTNNIKPDYSVSASPGSMTIKRGQAGSAAITITPVGGYSGSVQLTCSGLPAGAECVFQPPTASLSGTGAITVQLTFNTTGTNGTMSGMAMFTDKSIPPASTLAACSALAGFGLLILFGIERKKPAAARYVLSLLLLAAGSAVALGLAGCGSGASSSATPVGDYSISVTAASSGGSTSHAASVVINVTQ